MWLIPIGLAALTYTNLKPDVLNNQWEMLALVVAFGVGGVFGLGRGSLNRVELDQATKQIIVRGSVIGLIVWLGFVLLEIGFRFLLSRLDATDATLVTVLPLASATGLFSGWRAMWCIKYLQLNSYSEYRVSPR
jgi:hypothetical protein